MSRKDRRSILAYAHDLGIVGARIAYRGRHPHLVGTTPAGTALRYVLASTPSDTWRGQRNMRADLRRACRPDGGAGCAPATQRSAVEGVRTAGSLGGYPGVAAGSSAPAHGAENPPQRHARPRAGDGRVAHQQRSLAE